MIKKLTDKQSEILKVSKTLFFEKGYAETSMRDIASELNIRAASIYTHFDSKEQILEHILSAHTMSMEKSIILASSRSIPIEERFKAYVKRHIQQLLLNRESLILYIKYFYIVDKNLDGKFDKLNNLYLHSISELLRERFPMMRNPEGFAPDFNAVLFLDSLNNSPKWVITENADFDKITDVFCRFFTYGFSGK